jgi:Fe-S-cluster containining protein
MGNAFENALGIPLPKCCSLGSCCKGASPSTPYHQLFQRTVTPTEDGFARGFFSIMIPYPSHEAAEAVVPGLVARTKEAAKKQAVFQSDSDLVFYHCRYLTPENRCGVWEDRPQFCRDYPDTPFVVMAPGCAFEPWQAACKQKFDVLKSEVETLKTLKTELSQLSLTQPALIQSALTQPESCNANAVTTAIAFPVPDTSMLSLLLSLTDLYIASPQRSFFFYSI